ncbi:MAG: AAA family ATPase [Candidatus Hydrogenedentes bacterium]|nr:AAA family ATPase [Candidatus Hydrogenedentota bacterium]
MYLEHYRLAKEPFHIASTPGFFYMGENHREALAMMVYGVRKRLGFVALVGDVGTGKTTVLRAYLEHIRGSDIRTILMFNPNVTFEGLLLHILGGLGIDASGRDERWMLHALAYCLQQELNEGRTVALVIDEAHHLPLATLEKMHLISNLETGQGKLLQVVFLAQPELDDIIQDDRLRQIRQRIAVRYYLRPLRYWESRAYLRFRIQRAGGDPDYVFTRSAIKALARSAKGVPRLLNIFADNALITGMGHGMRPVTPKVVREVVRDFSPRRRFHFWRWAAAAALVIVAGTALAAFAGATLSPNVVDSPDGTSIGARAPQPVARVYSTRDSAASATSSEDSTETIP